MTTVLGWFPLSLMVFPKINILPVEGSSVGIRLEDFVLLAMGVYWALFYLPKRWKKLTDGVFVPVLLVFGAYLTLTVILADGVFHTVDSTSIALLHLGRYAQFFLVYALFASTSWNDRAIRSLAFVLVGVLGFEILYSLFQIIGIAPYFTTMTSIHPGSPVDFRNIGVVIGTFGGHYDFAMFLVMGLCGLGICYSEHRAKGSQSGHWLKKVLIAGGVLANLGMLLMTHSRSALLACIMVLFSWGILRRSPKMVVLSVLSLISMVWLYLTGRVSTFLTHWHLGSTQLTVDLSTAQRLDKWRNVVTGQGLVQWIFGHGLSSLGVAVDGYYLRLLGETGLIGVAVFCWLLWTILSVSKKIRTQSVWERCVSDWVYLSTIAMIIQALFIDIFVSSKVMFLYCAMLGVLGSINYESEKRKQQRVTDMV